MKAKTPKDTENAKQGKKVLAKRPTYFVAGVGAIEADDLSQVEEELKKRKDGDGNI